MEAYSDAHHMPYMKLNYPQFARKHGEGHRTQV